MGIRATFFDLGGVVYRLDWDGVARHWEEQLGLEPGGFFAAVYGGTDDTVLIGKVRAEDHWATVYEQFGMGGEARALLESQLSAGSTVDRDLAAFIRGLRPGHRTAFISNAWSDSRSWLRRDGIEDAVDHAILSAEVGVAKPDKRIFEIALERCGVAPEEAVFVDDWLGHVEAARALGLHGVQHRSTADTIAEVRALLAI